MAPSTNPELSPQHSKQPGSPLFGDITLSESQGSGLSPAPNQNKLGEVPGHLGQGGCCQRGLTGSGTSRHLPCRRGDCLGTCLGYQGRCLLSLPFPLPVSAPHPVLEALGRSVCFVLIFVAASGPLPLAVCGLSSCGVRAQSPRGTWGLSSPTRGHSCVPRVAGWFLNHRTTRDVLEVWFCCTSPVPPLSPVMLGNPLKVWPAE